MVPKLSALLSVTVIRRSATKTQTECVGCLKDSDCGDDAPLCDTDLNVCVACLINSDCSADMPVCDAGACSKCTTNDDCGDFSDTPVCDDVSGSCVACTPETEETRCGAKSCNPATFECGPNDRESQGNCRSCISDSDCESNHQCVPMQYPSGTPREGGYCLELSGSCGEPYTVLLSGRTTLSDVTGESYCGINEDLTTCDAVRALEDNLRCDSLLKGDGQCWPNGGTVADAIEVPGALCRKFEGIAGERCTYECEGNQECPSAATVSVCGAGTLPVPVTPDFCGGKAN